MDEEHQEGPQQEETQLEVQEEEELSQQENLIKQQLEEQLFKKYKIEELSSLVSLIVKNMEVMQETVNLVVQRVDQVVKLHQDQTATQLTLMSEMESLIKIQSDQIADNQAYLDKMALVTQALSRIEENLRKDLSEMEENQPEEG